MKGSVIKQAGGIPGYTVKGVFSLFVYCLFLLQLPPTKSRMAPGLPGRRTLCFPGDPWGMYVEWNMLRDTENLLQQPRKGDGAQAGAGRQTELLNVGCGGQMTLGWEPE